MTPEEKARAYDKTISKLQSLIANANKQGHIIVRVEDIENNFPELKDSEDEKIRKAILNYLKKMWGNCKDNVCGIHVEDAIAWLEKQCEQKSKKVSIWKHWKNGIAGNGEGKQIFLTKFNNIYKFSSYLNSECDYIELSELDNLLLEKQDETFTKKDVDDAYLKGVSDTKTELEKQGGSNPYSGVTFEYNGHTWGMCARDGGVEILVDGEIKERVFLDNLRGEQNTTEFDDTNAKRMFIKALESVEELKDKGYKLTDCDKNSWWDDFKICTNPKIYTSDTYLSDAGQCIPPLCEDNVHRWTIEDAKDGDVLIASDESIFIYAGSTDRHAKFYLALTKCGKLNVDGGNWEDKNSVHPATKEQCGVLFAKMKEEGYEWDDEKKVLKKIEPKFHEGDWVVTDKDDTIQITTANPGYYILNNGMEFSKSYVDKYWHLWTIEDAKDGDVLATDKSVFIYAKVLCNKPYAYCGVDKYGVFKDNCLENNWTNSVDNIHPATKEQRDLLFQKITEAGYKRDAENKELNKIKMTDLMEDAPENYKKQLMSEITDLVEDYIRQKPVKWTEEDEKILQWIITDIKRLINDNKKANVIANKELDWLITIKERIGG